MHLYAACYVRMYKEIFLLTSISRLTITDTTTDTGARSIRKKQISIKKVMVFQSCPRDRQSFLASNVVAIYTPKHACVC